MRNKLLLKNFASLGVVQIVNYVFPLLTIPYISRILGPSGLGLVNYFAAFIAYFTLVVSYSFDMSGTRDISKNTEDDSHINEIFCRISNARIFLFILATIIFSILVFSVSKFSTHLMLSFVIYLNVISVLISTQYIYQGVQKIWFFGVLNLFKGIFVTTSIFLLIRKDTDYIIYAGITSTISFLINLFLFIYAYNNFNLKFKILPISSTFKSLIKDKHLFLSSVVFNLYTSTNIIILGFFESTTIVGYYTVALGLISIIQSVLNIPMSVALFPFIGSSFSISVDYGLDQLRKIFPIVFYIAFLGGIVLFFLSPLLVHIIYGKDFANSIIAVKILCFLPLLSCLSSIFGTLTMINLKMDKEFFAVTFFASVISLCLNFLLVNSFGYVGTAVSYLITEIFVILGLFYSLKRKGINLIKKENFHYSSVINTLKKIR